MRVRLNGLIALNAGPFAEPHAWLFDRSFALCLRRGALAQLNCFGLGRHTLDREERRTNQCSQLYQPSTSSIAYDPNP